MKTEQQVRDKLKECESVIQLQLDQEFNDVVALSGLKNARTALLWVLSDNEKIEIDELTKKLDWEITCIESTEIF